MIRRSTRFVMRLASAAWLTVAAVGCASAGEAKPAAAAPSSLTRRPAPAQLGEWIDAYASAFGRNWGPSYAFTGYLGVARDGQWVYGRAFGKANHEQGSAADADTRFRIGSVTKQFTAVALMQLVERGAVQVDDPIGRYVPNLSDDISKVTLHQLLQHSSGIASYTDDEALMAHDREPHAASEVLGSFAQKPLRFTPGERFEYSNSNYFLLGLVIEKASGVSYEAYLQKFVLEPAGLQRTSTIDAPDAPNTAVGYTSNDAHTALVPDGPFDMSMPFSAGALRSTANDLLAWDRAWTAHTLLSATSQARMTKLEPKLTQPNGSGYGYGLGVSQNEGIEVVAHGGGIRGFTSYLARIPQEGWMVVALCNASSFDAGSVAKPVVDMIIKSAAIAPRVETPVRPMDAALRSAVAGKYTLSEAVLEQVAEQLPARVVQSIRTLSLAVEAEQLFLVQGETRIALFLGPEGQLFTKHGDISLTFQPSAQAPQGMIVKQGQLALPYERAK
jgi:D-alanyl-D-alanine carboxypeptidase